MSSVPTDSPTEADEATATNPPKETPAAEEEIGNTPTLEPTYLTYEPTENPAENQAQTEEKEPVPQPTQPPIEEQATPTMEPTYLTFSPTKKEVTVTAGTPTVEPTYLTYSPTPKQPVPSFEPDVTDSPTPEPSYLTYDPTDQPSTGYPTIAPTKTHAPTTANSVEDSQSNTEFANLPKPVPTPTNMPVAGQPTKEPTILSTAKPTNPKAVIKEEKFRNKLVGFQSDWGPAHPGGMTYDFSRNSIYVSGTMFAENQMSGSSSSFQRSTCFVGELPIADLEAWVVDDPPLPLGATGNDFMVPDSFDAREQMGCHVVYYDENADQLLVPSVTEPDATDRRGKINPGVSIYSRTRYDPNWQQTGAPYGLGNMGEKVRWPVAVTKGLNDDEIMMVSVASDDPLLTEEYIFNGDANNAQNFKNSLQCPGHSLADPNKYNIPKRGSNFQMVLERLDSSNMRQIGGEEIKGGGDIFPSDVAYVGEHFVFSGSMRGKPPQRFRMEDPVDINNNVHLDDFDGFVTGMFYPSGRPTFEGNLNVRFDSKEANPPLDDYAHSICLPPPNEKGQINFYYVVGSSFGTMFAGYAQSEITTNILGGLDAINNGNQEKRLSAWVSKVDLSRKNERAIVWTTQIFATNDNISLAGGMTEAFGCHVVDQKKANMYVGGTVYNGGTVDSQQKSAGGDDVWVAKLNTNDGSIKWIKQIGSSGDERLAKNNGVESDLNGHAIIFGETTGELYRKKRGEPKKTMDGTSSNIFVTTLDFDTGASESTIEGDRSSTIKRDAIIGAAATAGLLLICLFFGYIFKWRRAARYAAKDVDGVMQTNSKNLEGDAEDSALTAKKSSKKKFKDSASDDGTEPTNGDASGGLSKLV